MVGRVLIRSPGKPEPPKYPLMSTSGPAPKPTSGPAKVVGPIAPRRRGEEGQNKGEEARVALKTIHGIMGISNSFLGMRGRSGNISFLGNPRKVLEVASGQ